MGLVKLNILYIKMSPPKVPPMKAAVRATLAWSAAVLLSANTE